MITKGAMATTGVTCSVTASGRAAASAMRLSETATASPPPTRVATNSAWSAIHRVFQAEARSRGALSIRAAATALGGGRR